MKAFLCKEFGPIESHKVEEIEEPVAGPGEVVVDIKATGISFPDVLIVQGFTTIQQLGSTIAKRKIFILLNPNGYTTKSLVKLILMVIFYTQKRIPLFFSDCLLSRNGGCILLLL